MQQFWSSGHRDHSNQPATADVHMPQRQGQISARLHNLFLRLKLEALFNMSEF